MAVDHPHDISAGGSECPDAEALTAYLDGTLDPAEREAVETHLADCASCRESLADTITFLEEEEARAAVEPAPSADVVPFPSRDTRDTPPSPVVPLPGGPRAWPRWRPLPCCCS